MKRIFDFVLALVLLVVLAPLFVLLAVGVLLALGRPIVFVQQRPGLHGQPFDLVKFRSMRDRVDESGQPLPDAERLGRFGAVLRRSSLDELPELWNIIKGDMSFVGPRPLLMEYLPLYSEEQARRHLVRPGLTGWAQVNGRNSLSWEERFELDVWYVDHQSMLLDIQIMLKTVKILFTGKNISHPGQATMKRFRGDANESH